MKPKIFKHCLAVWILALFPLAAQAQETPVQELERRLQQRDSTIIELLDRVEALEQRVGVRRQPKQPDESLQQDIAPPGEADIAQSPGAVVVEEGAAERALERSLTRAGVLLLPTGVLEIEPGIIYSQREDTSPGFVTADNQILPSETELKAKSLTADLAMRLGLPWDSQLEIGLPYRWREVESVTKIGFVPTDSSKRSDNGIGDLRLGFAKTLLREGLWRPDVVGRFTWDTDSGDTGGFEEFRTSLSALKRQDPLTFVGGLAYEYTSRDGEIKPGAATSVNFGSYIALSPETSLNFIFSATHQDETEQSGDEIDGSDRDFGTLVIGGSTLLARGTLFHFSVGVGLTDDAEDFAVNMSLPIRLDGRLF